MEPIIQSINAFICCKLGFLEETYVHIMFDKYDTSARCFENMVNNATLSCLIA